jgi:hypothetical protein
MKHFKSNLAFYIPLVIVLVVIGAIVWSFLSNRFSPPASQVKQKPLMGQIVPVLSREHVSDGTKIQYNSNPPAAGAHYVQPQDAGIYSKPPADGHLVHSLEHGAIILWYNPNKLPKDQVAKLIAIFRAFPQQKKIMTPRTSLDVPVALSSWGRILKLQTIDTKQIKAFFETNYDRGPEQADI